MLFVKESVIYADPARVFAFHELPDAFRDVGEIAVHEREASGLVQRAIERAGERGIEVAPREAPIVTGTVPTAGPR